MMCCLCKCVSKQFDMEKRSSKPIYHVLFTFVVRESLSLLLYLPDFDNNFVVYEIHFKIK